MEVLPSAQHYVWSYSPLSLTGVSHEMMEIRNHCHRIYYFECDYIPVGSLDLQQMLHF